MPHKMDDLIVRVLDTLATSDDTDLTTQLSLSIFEFRTKDLDLDDSTTAYSRWLSELLAWMIDKTSKEKINFLSALLVKTDDRLADAACHAAHRSFKLLMEQVGQPGADHCFSVKNPVKSLHERVLASFELFCKNMSIENSWPAIHLKYNIGMAALLAKQYIKTQPHQLRLPEDTHEYGDNFLRHILQRYLMPNFFHGDTATHIQCATETIDDGLVGLGSDLMKIKERLTGTLSKLDIIQIIGMGGIGKTTLTKRVYEDPQIMFHFHVRAWVLVSQDYRERDVLLGLLQSIAPLPEEVYKEDKEQLAELLYRRLKGQRYFIVIDDIWTKEAWDHMKQCFPDDNEGSRIILTSRLAEVASYVNPQSPPHFMNFLGPEDSWELLHKNVFRKGSCLPQLVNVGKRIAEKCQGLPLAVKVVAGHLSKISMKKECWEDVAEKVGLTEVTQMDSLLNVLAISYNNLPQHLKACFLTMVIFPKNFEIPVRKLIRLWSAMGFLYSNTPDSLEEVAMKCFEDLINRSLIMVRKRKLDGKVKSCSIHDLLWDLSIREARKEGEYIFGKTCLSHFCFDTSNDWKYVMGLSRTLLYFDFSLESDFLLNSPEFKQLSVMDILNQSFDPFPDEVTDLVNLRYLALATSSNIPGSVAKLCNLETFIIINHEGAGQKLPKEIWLLARLRHLHVGNHSYLSDPVSALPNLQELSVISSANCTEEVFLKVPNLIELRIHHRVEEENMADELLFNCLNNLVHLQKLEKLMLRCTGQLIIPSRILQWDSFVPNVKHLTLFGTCLPWNQMNALARLPDLEVLKLKWYSFVGEEWETDVEFPRLKCLLLDSLDLKFWKANQDHFPNLQFLGIRNCLNMCRIPNDFGEISTLHLIDLGYCNNLICRSAREIQIEQLNMGNDKLIIRIARTSTEQQNAGFMLAFVYLTLRLKMLQAKQETYNIETETDTLGHREVLAGECSGSKSLAKDSDY